MMNKSSPVIISLLCMFALTEPAVAGTCLSDSRIVSTGKNTIRLQDYRCRTNAGAQVRVQFHRVTDFVASAMLSSRLPAIFRQVLGQPYFINNPVYGEYKLLMDNFGASHKWLSCENYTIAVSGGGGSIQENNDCKSGGPTLKTLGGWHNAGDHLVIAVPSDMAALMGGRVPGTYRNKISSYANAAQRDIWRYVTWEDLSNYPQKVARFNQMMTGLREGGGTGANSRYMGLMKRISRAGLPRDFLAIDAYYSPEEGCEGFVGWKMHLLERAMLVDFAIIENVSRQPVAITKLFGARTVSKKLRRQSRSKLLERAAPVDLGLVGAMLKPGERAVLFQRLTFVVPPQNRDGFKAALPDYVYGPETALKGFSLNGERVDLSQSLGNYLGLTAGVEGGSCPFVYAWSDAEKTFINYGKILDKANGKDKEQSDSMSFEGFVSRFRIAEEEAEIVHLDQVYLIVEMKDGRRIRLAAKPAGLKDNDRKRISLAMGNEIKLKFSLPSGVKPDEVARSVLTARGYYQRYSALPYSQAGMRGSIKALLNRVQ